MEGFFSLSEFGEGKGFPVEAFIQDGLILGEACFLSEIAGFLGQGALYFSVLGSIDFEFVDIVAVFGRF